MSTGLARSTKHFGDIYEQRILNVFDIATKTIVFTGDKTDCAKYLGSHPETVKLAANRRGRMKSKLNGKKYAIRIASNNQQ